MYRFVLSLMLVALSGCRLSEITGPRPSGPARSIALGPGRSCALDDIGAAFCWGGSIRFATAPKNHLPTATAAGTWRQLVTGETADCGLNAAGETWCWDAGLSGVLLLHPFARATATRLAGDPGFAALYAGYGHFCGLTADGRASCWGDDQRGALGAGDKGNAPDFIDAATPVAGEARFSQLALGNGWSCGLSTAGDVLCWGGRASRGGSTAPEPVVTGRAFVALTTGGPSVGRDRSCAIDHAHAVWCWGSFRQGAVTPALVPAPAGVHFTSIALGGIDVMVKGAVTYPWHACALGDDGRAYCWGSNGYGQLGDGTTTDRDRPAAVPGSAAFTELATGGAHSCGRTSEGTLLCWGRDIEGQVGDGQETADIIATGPRRVTSF